MSDIVLRVENVWKRYNLGQINAKTLAGDIQRLYAKIKGAEDPFSKVGEVSQKNSELDCFWALKDINFELERGEVLGVIGKNGAGKSTLLKILSKVTSPTHGKIFLNGRIASLLEVGTGFHPELSGRENVFLNGAILGMKKKEIQRKFDDIVAFSEVSKFIDTPVKRYSSGMYVRLAFAVAAFLEPEILIVDEVLAVGDLEFQKKALGKMNDVSQSDGRTVLFVSHNMGAIKKLCNNCLLLKNGQSILHGNTFEVVSKYQEDIFSENSTFFHWDDIGNAPGNEYLKVVKIELKPVSGRHISVNSGVELNVTFFNYLVDLNLDITTELLNQDDLLIFHQGVILSKNNDSRHGEYDVKMSIPPNLLNSGFYTLNLIFGKNQSVILFKMNNCVNFYMENNIDNQGRNSNILPGILKPNLVWNINYRGN